MKSNQSLPAKPPPLLTDYEEERIPFQQVMRKLANTKPPHKAAKPAPSSVPAKVKGPAKKD